MKIELFNDAPVLKQLWECSVCKKQYSWSENHRYIERPVGNDYEGYEVMFITCSDECRINQKKEFIKWLSNYPGWTVKKATENWEKYIEHSIKK